MLEINLRSQKNVPMILNPRKTGIRPLLLLMFFATVRLAAAPAGPTLQLDYGHGAPQTNAVSEFMYFVPLISPEPVSVITNAGNTQCVRISSSACRVSGNTFVATCNFEFTGEGSQQNILDHTDKIHEHEEDLKAGGSLKRQLSSICVEGAGNGSVEIEGTVTNGVRSVNEVRLQFNGRGKPSPVSIGLEDIIYHDGAVKVENAIVARVNALTFRRGTGNPKMEVTLASLKAKDAGDSAWSNFMGSLKGMVANQFIPPITVEATGHQAMLDFGEALAAEKPAFTFPFAARLKTATATGP